jgi:hypothetical protein
MNNETPSVEEIERIAGIFREMLSQPCENEIQFLTRWFPELASALGYRKNEFLFESSLGPESQHRADLVLGSGSERIIVEAKYERERNPRYERLWQSGLDQLRDYLRIGESRIGALISNRRIALFVNENEVTYSFDTISPDEVAIIIRSLKKSGQTVSRPISSPETSMSRMLEAVCQAGTNDEKKNTLERLAAVMLDGLQSVRCKYPNLRTRSSEIDLVCECVTGNAPTALHEYGRYFLVECKNWQVPAGAIVMRDFIGKIRKTRCKVGILFSRNGITGEEDGADAVREMSSAYDRDGIIVIVLTGQDLEGIARGSSFERLIDTRLDAIRFDF